MARLRAGLMARLLTGGAPGTPGWAGGAERGLARVGGSLYGCAAIAPVCSYAASGRRAGGPPQLDSPVCGGGSWGTERVEPERRRLPGRAVPSLLL
ncbi:hypothetical protein ACFSTC_57995 [Nonomuraea ferruginea]